METLEILAKTIYGEARGEGVEGMEAVASVILNRVNVAKAHGGKYWWGNDIDQVCLKPWQFSCWNKKDPNSCVLAKDLSKDSVYILCEAVASRAIYGKIKDETGGATHYHAMRVKPKWAEGKIPTTIIGHHLFYKLEG